MIGIWDPSDRTGDGQTLITLKTPPYLILGLILQLNTFVIEP